MLRLGAFICWSCLLISKVTGQEREIIIEAEITIEPHYRCGVRIPDSIVIFQNDSLILCLPHDTSGLVKLRQKENGEPWFTPNHEYKILSFLPNGKSPQYQGSFETFGLKNSARFIIKLISSFGCGGPPPEIIFTENSDYLDKNNHNNWLVLEDISSMLCDYKKLIIEIGGYREPEEKKSTSKKRAEAVVNYFVETGVGIDRLPLKDYGIEGCCTNYDSLALELAIPGEDNHPRHNRTVGFKVISFE